jgi:hypothetical protein
MTSIVTAHRMAFAFSPTRTVLWDQIQYAGDPKEFSWVLPVRGDAKLETADDAWFEALEAVTSTRVSPPQLNCFTPSQGTSSNSCSCGGFASSSSDSFAGSAGGTGTTISPDVMVEHQGTVGPYQYVELTATNSQSLESWLADNGYVVPPDIQPVVAAYVRDGFGFIALKLRPDAGTREMTPVRVITPGASPTLPLRMVAAGTGATVAITLYVIAEGRYEPDGPTMVSVDFSKLSWDWNTAGSNYPVMRQSALASGDGAGWLTSFAQHRAFTSTYTDPLGEALTFTPKPLTLPNNSVGLGAFSTLSELYFAQAAANANQANLCASIAESLSSDAPVVDTCRAAPVPDPGAPAPVDAAPSTSADAAARDAAAESSRSDAASDAQHAPAVVCDPAPPGSLAAHDFECGSFSDIAAAMIGMHPRDVWITRLEASLPHAKLSDDLRVHPSNNQTDVTQVHRAITHVNPPCDLLENHPEAALLPAGPRRGERMGPAAFGSRLRDDTGIQVVSAALLLAMRRWTRRRR